MLMITFLTLQCRRICNDVMQAVVLEPETRLRPTTRRGSGSFTEGQGADSSEGQGSTQAPGLARCMLIRAGPETTALSPAAHRGGPPPRAPADIHTLQAPWAADASCLLVRF